MSIVVGKYQRSRRGGGISYQQRQWRDPTSSKVYRMPNQDGPGSPGQEVDHFDNQRYRFEQNWAVQPALRIYSRHYSKGPFNAFERAREGGLYRMRGRKEITDDGVVEAY